MSECNIVISVLEDETLIKLIIAEVKRRPMYIVDRIVAGDDE